MNLNLTEIVVLIDESGSMGNIRQDTIGGFNTFLADQKKLVDGKASLTVVTFSSSVRTVINGVDVQEVEDLTEATYRPSGGTSLLDAIGQTIDSLEERYTDEEDTDKIPGKVIFVIITDGEENSSKIYTKSKINKMIKHQTKRHGWEFAFLGSNLDSVQEAQNLGINAKSAFNFSNRADHVHDTFGVLSSATAMYRSSGVASYDTVGTSLENLNLNTNITINSSSNPDEIANSIKDALQKGISGAKI